MKSRYQFQERLLNAKLALAACLLVTLESTSSLSALEWFTMDGGGAIGSGGPYALAGTIGQPDAGVSGGGTYTVTGGFWGGAYQGPIPTLSITLSDENAVLQWPS